MDHITLLRSNPHASMNGWKKAIYKEKRIIFLAFLCCWFHRLRKKKTPSVMKYVYVYVLRRYSFLECAGTIGHVAHGKSTVVKAISGVQVILMLMPSIHHMLYLCSFYKYCTNSSYAVSLFLLQVL